MSGSLFIQQNSTAATTANIRFRLSTIAPAPPTGETKRITESSCGATCHKPIRRKWKSTFRKFASGKSAAAAWPAFSMNLSAPRIATPTSEKPDGRPTRNEGLTYMRRGLPVASRFAGNAFQNGGIEPDPLCTHEQRQNKKDGQILGSGTRAMD